MHGSAITWKRVWKIGGILAALLCCMPSLLILVVWAVHSATGTALWVTYEEAPEWSDILSLPFLFLLGNWPLLVLAGATLVRQNRRRDPRTMLFINCCAILALAAANVLFWIATPEEWFLDAPDAGQGTGVALALLIFIAPVVALLGGLAGLALASIKIGSGRM